MRKGMWFGVFFLLLGVSILIKVFFKIDIPVFRSVVALFLIYLGVKMLFGGRFFSCSIDKGQHHDNAVAFGEKTFKFEATTSENDFVGQSGKDYSTVFGSSTVDLSDVTLEPGKDKNFEVNTVFAETVVLLKKDTPVRVRSSAVFAEARMPNNDVVAFGALNYQEPKEAPNYVNIRANVVFGSLKIQYK